MKSICTLLIFLSAVLAAAPAAQGADCSGAVQREVAVVRSFSSGDYPRYANSLEALITRHPADPVSVLHYGDLFRLADHLGAGRIAKIAEKIRGTLAAGGDDRANACLINFNCRLEQLLYRFDPASAKRLTDELKPMRSWTLYGPYRKYGPADQGYPFQPEVVSAASEIYPQKRIRVSRSDGWLDPGDHVFPAAGVVYAKASFRWRGPLRLRVFSRSLYTVFVNGRAVARNAAGSRRTMRSIRADSARGITVMVKLYGRPFDRMRMLVTDTYDVPVSPEIVPDASFSGDCDASEERDFPGAAPAAGRDGDPRAAAQLGSYFDDCESEEAEACYRDSLAKRPDPGVSFRLARSLMHAGPAGRPAAYAEGLGIITGLMNREPAFFPARLRWLEHLVDAREYAKALRVAEDLSAAAPNNPFPAVIYLRLCTLLGYEKEFIDAAAKARAVYPDSVPVMEEEAGFYATRDRGRFLDSMKELLKRDITPDRVRCVIREYMSRGDYKAALDLIRAHDSNSAFMDEAVEIHIRNRDFRAARNLILPALVASDRPSLYRALGVIDLLQSDDPAMYFQKALDIDPSRYDYSDYCRYLGSGMVENPFSVFMERRGPVDFSWHKKKYERYHTAVLYRGRIFMLRNDGGGRVFCEDIIQVNDGEGAAKYAEIPIPFRGNVRPVRMRVYDGTGAFTDSCELRTTREDSFIAVRAPGKNSILHLSYIVDEPVMTARGSALFSLPAEHLQQYDEPVQSASIRVVAPAGMKVNFRFGTAVPVRTSMVEGMRVHAASIGEIPAVAHDRRGEGTGRLYSYSFSTMQGFDDFATWYGGLVNEQAGQDDPPPFSAGSGRIEDAVAGVHDFILREIAPDGVGLADPAAPETVLFRKRGSAENRALLARSLLRGLGIKSYIALARNRSLPDAGTYVTHDYFTAVLLYVPLDIENAVWLDFSSGSPRCGDVAANVAGTTALVLMQGSYRFRKIESGGAASLQKDAVPAPGAVMQRP